MDPGPLGLASAYAAAERALALARAGRLAGRWLTGADGAPSSSPTAASASPSLLLRIRRALLRDAGPIQGPEAASALAARSPARVATSSSAHPAAPANRPRELSMADAARLAAALEDAVGARTAERCSELSWGRADGGLAELYSSLSLLPLGAVSTGAPGMEGLQEMATAGGEGGFGPQSTLLELEPQTLQAEILFGDHEHGGCISPRPTRSPAPVLAPLSLNLDALIFSSAEARTPSARLYSSTEPSPCGLRAAPTAGPDAGGWMPQRPPSGGRGPRRALFMPPVIHDRAVGSPIHPAREADAAVDEDDAASDRLSPPESGAVTALRDSLGAAWASQRIRAVLAAAAADAAAATGAADTADAGGAEPGRD